MIDQLMTFATQHWPHALTVLATAVAFKAADRFFLKELSLLEDIQDSEIRAWLAQGLVLLGKKFPVGGVPLAVHQLVRTIPELAPFEPGLEEFVVDLGKHLAADVDAAVKKNASAPQAPALPTSPAA